MCQCLIALFQSLIGPFQHSVTLYFSTRRILFLKGRWEVLDDAVMSADCHSFDMICTLWFDKSDIKLLYVFIFVSSEFVNICVFSCLTGTPITFLHFQNKMWSIFQDFCENSLTKVKIMILTLAQFDPELLSCAFPSLFKMFYKAVHYDVHEAVFS